VRLVPIGSRTADYRRAGRPARVLASVIALVAGLVVVAGCRVPGMAPPTAAVPTVKADITVAETPGVGDAPLFIAFQEGLFRDAGVNVHIINYGNTKFSTRDELRDLQSGKVDVAFGDYADMFYAQAHALQLAKGNAAKAGLNLVLVADGYDAAANTMEVLTMPRSGIVTPRNLAGKSIGTTQAQVMPTSSGNGQQSAPYSLDTVATQSVLSNDNVSPSSITWTQLNTPQAMLNGLVTRKVDAILATEPTLFEAESQLGAVPVLDSFTGATANLPLFGYFSLRSFAARNHAGLTAFRDALMKAQGQADNQQALVRSTLEGSEGMSVQDASLLTIGQFPTTVNASDLQRVIGIMFFLGAIPAIQGTQLSAQSMIFH
jgi:NitT/TauT family transport system substrate-binding protein